MGKAALIKFVEPTGCGAISSISTAASSTASASAARHITTSQSKVDAERQFSEVVGKDVPHEIMSVGRWIARNVVADRYRSGASSSPATPPISTIRRPGSALNTGLGDAVDLGWKLAAVHRRLGAALPCSTATRSSAARSGIRNVGHADESHAGDRERPPGPAIADDTPEGARARQAIGDAIVPAQTRKVITDGLALGYRYDPSPIVWPDGTPAPEDTITDYHPTARPGSRAPHAFIAHGRSIIDLFGKGFVLHAAWAARRMCRQSNGRSRSAACRSRGDDRKSRHRRALRTLARPGAPGRPRRLARRCAAGRSAGARRPRARRLALRALFHSCSSHGCCSSHRDR